MLALLLGLSNNAALTKLGSHRWKTLQRWNYAGFALLIVHGAVYQLLEKRMAGFVLVFAAAILLVGALQTAGHRKVLQQKNPGGQPSVMSSDR